MTIYYSNYVDYLSSKHLDNKLFKFIGEKIGNITDPFEFEFKKKYGYISKNSIRCANGDIYRNIHIIK